MSDDIAVAIRTGDVATLSRFLAADSTLVHTRIDGQRTLLHIATDWPGHFPNVRETISALVTRGADVNARAVGMNHTETPLHWAASTDDVGALDALLDHGADIEANGAVIGGGTALSDAVVFGMWRAGRRLVERGAKTTIWQAAALGLMDQLKQHVAGNPAPQAAEMTNALWGACHGGQLEAARYLLECGADLHWVGHDQLTPLDAAARNGNAELVAWLRSRGAVSAQQAHAR